MRPCQHSITQLMSCLHRPATNLRIKPLHAGLLVLMIEYVVKAVVMEFTYCNDIIAYDTITIKNVKI